MSTKELSALSQLPATLGAKTEAESLSIAFATDTSGFPVNDGGESLTVDSTQLPTALGQTTSAGSLSVVLASDQSALAVSQSGTWNITNISGTVSLPTGAATETTLATVASDTTSLDTKIPAQGQALSAASLPVVLASDQPALDVSQSGTWNVTNISGTVSLPTGAATEATLSTVAGDTTSLDAKVPAQGQALSAASVPVVIASDQSAVPASQSGTWNITDVSGTVSLPTGAATEATLSTVAGDTTSLDTKVPAQGQALSAASLPVVIASDQSAVPASQSGTWNIADISGTVSLPTGAATEATLSTVAGDTTSIDGKLVQLALDTGAATGAVRTVLATRHEAAATPVAVRLSDGSAFQNLKTGRSKVELINHDHASTSVTTSAYVELVATTSAAIEQWHVFDSSGEGLIIATGAAASETDVLYIPPGGFSGPVDLSVAASTRISVKALTAATSSGNLIITALS